MDRNVSYNKTYHFPSISFKLFFKIKIYFKKIEFVFIFICMY